MSRGRDLHCQLISMLPIRYMETEWCDRCYACMIRNTHTRKGDLYICDTCTINDDVSTSRTDDKFIAAYPRLLVQAHIYDFEELTMILMRPGGPNASNNTYTYVLRLL